MAPFNHTAAAERIGESFGERQTPPARYRELFESALDGYLMTDLQGVIRESNAAAANLLNVRKEYLFDKPLGLYLAEKSRPAFYAMLARLAGCGIETSEVLLGQPRGRPRQVLLTMTVLRGEEGAPIGLSWTLRDVSAARRLEDALQTEKDLANCLLELSEIYILILDRTGRILRCNSFLPAATGHLAGELLDQDWSEALLPVEDADAGLLLLEQAWAEGAARSGVLGLQVRRGSRRFVSWSARPLGDSIVLVGQDVTQLQEAQRHALQAARLAAIGQMATGLVHESRNALQRSQACLSILALRLKSEPELLELLSRVQHAQDDLRRLFEDVRSYAAVLPLRPQPCDLRQIWREAWEDVHAAADRPGAELREESRDLHPFCVGDPFYLRQVFRNLLENALTSGADPVRVVVRCRESRLGEREAVEVRVRDNGPGFPAAERGRIFEPFFTTKVRGTGLGLAICKRIVETHGGRIEVGDTAGPGAEVVLILPRRGT